MKLPPLIVVGDPYEKKHLDYPENLCLIPWTGFSNNPNGTVRPCCLYGENIKNESGEEMYVQQNTLKEIFGSKYMKLPKSLETQCHRSSRLSSFTADSQGFRSFLGSAGSL